MTEAAPKQTIRYSDELRGYVWRVYQTEEGRAAEQEEGATEYGFHGLDVTPLITPGEYLADDSETTRKSFLVVTEDYEAPELVDGWEAEEAEIDEGWLYKDDVGYTVAALHRFADGSVLFVTYVG